MTPDFSNVFDAVRDALQGAPVPCGETGKLYVGDNEADPALKSNRQLPSLALSSGSFTAADYQDYSFRVLWTLPATLRVQGEANGGAVRNLRAVLTALVLRGRLIRGLPVDSATGLPVLDDDSIAFQQSIADGEITLLVDRKGPTLSAGTIVETSDTIAQANLTFTLEFVMKLDPRVMKHATVSVLGMTRFAGDIPTFNDLSAIGQFAEPPTVVIGASGIGEPALLQKGAVAGPEPSELPRALMTSPGSATLAALGTQQLTAIMIALDYSTRIVPAMWATGDALVATVDTAGLVTAVATGTATITATAVGLTATTAITVS